MKRSQRIRIAVPFAVMMPLAAVVAMAQQPVANAPEKVVTEANNGSAVTLNAGEVLVVRLKDNPSTGYSRALVSFPDMPVRLVSHETLAQAPASAGGVPIVGAAHVEEWKFAVAGKATYGRAVWLKLLHLRPFVKGVDTAGLWEIKVNVPPMPAK